MFGHFVKLALKGLREATYNHNLNLFSETNYKKQTHIWSSFYIQLSYIAFQFKKSFNLGLKKLGLPYWARINFMIYRTETWKILELAYCSRLDFMIYRNWT